MRYPGAIYLFVYTSVSIVWIVDGRKGSVARALRLDRPVWAEILVQADQAIDEMHQKYILHGVCTITDYIFNLV